MKFIKIPTEFLKLFPITVDNLRVELLEDKQGDLYISEKSFVWNLFNKKVTKQQGKKDLLAPLYEYLLTAERVTIELKENKTGI